MVARDEHPDELPKNPPESEGKNEGMKNDFDRDREWLTEETKSELLALKKDIANNTENADQVRDYLSDFISPEKNNSPEHSDTPDLAYKKTFQTTPPNLTYSFSQHRFARFVASCEASPLGKDFIRDVIGFLLGTTDSLVDIGRLSVHTMWDLLACIVWLRNEVNRTRAILDENKSL